MFLIYLDALYCRKQNIFMYIEGKFLFHKLTSLFKTILEKYAMQFYNKLVYIKLFSIDHFL